MHGLWVLEYERYPSCGGGVSVGARTTVRRCTQRREEAGVWLAMNTVQ
mgnify:CR=1 FL=1